MNEKIYLGDGVYAWYDGYHVWLETLEGMRIALDDSVQSALVDYIKRVNGVEEDA